MDLDGGTLFLVGVPIGNLGDISRRAIEVLSSVDLVASESPSAARRLFSALSIRARLTHFREQDREKQGRFLLEELKSGRSVALISEAGMPTISDPGWYLVDLCHRESIAVSCIPGASAGLAALVLSGYPARRFAFEGFLPRKGRERKERLEALRRCEHPVVVFESAQRLRETLTELGHWMPGRELCVARELTKQFECLYRGSVEEILQSLPEPLKGEVVLVLGPDESEDAEPAFPSQEDCDFLLELGLSVKQASAVLARQSGIDRKRLYKHLSNSVRVSDEPSNARKGSGPVEK